MPGTPTFKAAMKLLWQCKNESIFINIMAQCRIIIATMIFSPLYFNNGLLQTDWHSSNLKLKTVSPNRCASMFTPMTLLCGYRGSAIWQHWLGNKSLIAFTLLSPWSIKMDTMMWTLCGEPSVNNCRWCIGAIYSSKMFILVTIATAWRNERC